MVPCGGNRGFRARRSSCVRANFFHRRPVSLAIRSRPGALKAGCLTIARVRYPARWSRSSGGQRLRQRPTATADTRLRELPYGPYILSVHSRGYYKSRGRTVQLTTAKISIPEIQLSRETAQKVPVVESVPVAVAPAVQTRLAGFSLDAVFAAGTRGGPGAAADSGWPWWR